MLNTTSIVVNSETSIEELKEKEYTEEAKNKITAIHFNHIPHKKDTLWEYLNNEFKKVTEICFLEGEDLEINIDFNNELFNRITKITFLSKKIVIKKFYFSSFPVLEKLHIKVKEIKDLNFYSPVAASSLKYLYIGTSELSLIGTSFINKFPNLECLYLAFLKNENMVDFNSLSLPRLKSLSLEVEKNLEPYISIFKNLNKENFPKLKILNAYFPSKELPVNSEVKDKEVSFRLGRIDVSELGSAFLNLERLFISNIDFISPKTSSDKETLFKEFSSLKVIHLCNVKFSGVVAVISDSLEELKLKNTCIKGYCPYKVKIKYLNLENSNVKGIKIRAKESFMYNNFTHKDKDAIKSNPLIIKNILKTSKMKYLNLQIKGFHRDSKELTNVSNTTSEIFNFLKKNWSKIKVNSSDIRNIKKELKNILTRTYSMLCFYDVRIGLFDLDSNTPKITVSYSDGNQLNFNLKGDLK